MEKQTEITETVPKGNRPVYDFKIGAFKAAVFLREIDGRSVPSVVLEKSFTSDGKNWKHKKMSLLNTSEIDKLICVLQDVKKALYLESFQ